MKVVRGVVSEELSSFLTDYIRTYKDAITYMFSSGYITEDLKDLGTYRDRQVLGTFSQYSNRTIETLLKRLRPRVEEETGKTLFESFSYLRAYKNGDELLKHKDVNACEIACTIHLGGDLWSIFLEGEEIVLGVGDMLIYDGVNEFHWRDKFIGNDCIQVMLFYLDATRKDIDEQKYDGRPLLGVPVYFNNRETLESDY